MTADAQFWDGLAEQYAAKPVENPDAFDRKIAITKAHIGSAHQVLDVGCGTGSLALRLAPVAGHVHGLDLSSEMIRIAREKLAASSSQNISFHVGAFDGSVPFEPESLDVICAYSLLHLVDDRAETLSTIYRLLKPGGSFISSTVCLGDSWVPYRPLLAVMRWMGKAPMVQIVSPSRLIEEVRNAGFVGLDTPDVGAGSTTAFLVATKPG
jgi:arsenite methyltransferase